MKDAEKPEADLKARSKTCPLPHRGNMLKVIKMADALPDNHSYNIKGFKTCPSPFSPLPASAMDGQSHGQSGQR